MLDYAGMQLNLDLMAINHLDLFAKYVSLTCMDWYRTGIRGYPLSRSAIIIIWNNGK